ncbi:SRPBCC family protein [Mucilaginibacter arboris]|uniref:Polyketide cyclase/dehydrase n=1 Tax=Mucilaginibacter arboris TaxID=2682090 RepID=A0A7K1SYC3_9SPHI|nr:SRPBCC family protein [Mucilaginibacter arboris]MVN22030.1 polyketide cyclase/dehydrase [Mucilaginibacter arboris]
MFKKSILSALTGMLFITGCTEVSVNSANPKAPIYSTKTIIIKASPKKVWTVLANIKDWNNWLPNVSQTKLNGVLKPNTTFDWKASGMTIHSTLRTVKPYSQLGWTGSVYTIYAVHTWSFVEVNGSSTKVIVSESMQGFLAWLFQKPFQKTLEKDMIESINALKRTSE